MQIRINEYIYTEFNYELGSYKQDIGNDRK